MAKRKTRETFGQVEKLPSGRYRARYTGPDGKRYPAPMTFDTTTDARTWLSLRRTEIARDEWRPRTKRKSVTFGDYAREHIDTRTNSRGETLKPRTRDEYTRLLEGPLRMFQGRDLQSIAAEDVRRWNRDQLATGKATQTARAYLLLKSVMGTAVEDGYIKSNPCRIKGAAKASTGKNVLPPTAAELSIIVSTIDPRLSLMVEVAAWGGLRWGEITELRRGDIAFDGETTVVSIARAVTYTKSAGFVVGRPKSLAGIRSVSLPPMLTPAMRARLDMIAPDDAALLFPSLSDSEKHFHPGSFAQYFRHARATAGRVDMPFHALRHFGLTQYAMVGATTRELMNRAGHNDVAVAMRYQHEAGRDAELAARMGTMSIRSTR